MARPVEQVVDPVAQDLRPQVPDTALAQQREVVGVVEQGAGGARVGGDPAELRHAQQRPGELPEPVQDGEGRPRRPQQPVLMGLRARPPAVADQRQPAFADERGEVLGDGHDVDPSRVFAWQRTSATRYAKLLARGEGTERIQFFSDAVFAIAMTLLVLEIRLPETEWRRLSWAALAALWPQLFAYAAELRDHRHNWVTHHRKFLVIVRFDGLLW